MRALVGVAPGEHELLEGGSCFLAKDLRREVMPRLVYEGASKIQASCSNERGPIPRLVSERVFDQAPASMREA